jgi:hypothetical protein
LRPEKLAITFPQDDVQLLASLRWDDAPGACELVTGVAPVVALAHHGIYSGSEIAVTVDALTELELEGPTSEVTPGDLAYTFVRAADHYGLSQDVPELCWFYDHDARPSMWEGPVKVSVFARFEDLGALDAISRRMRVEGAKPVRIAIA